LPDDARSQDCDGGGDWHGSGRGDWRTAGGKKHRGEGAAIGAAAGALLGTGIGWYMDRQAKKLEQTIEDQNTIVEAVEVPVQNPDGTQGTQVQQINIRMIGDVYFDKSKATLRPEAEMKLREIAASLKEYPDSNVVIEGHTSSEGSISFNQTLSVNRANSVSAYLVTAGISPTRITATGYGPDKQIGRAHV
jgi:outer membrane protein OmpA-like peptidoglycan-associated protein